MMTIRLIHRPSDFCRFLLIATLGIAMPAFAQFRVEVSGVGLTQLPIAFATFRGDDGSPQKVGAIIQADLERSGQFRLIESAPAVMDENTRPDLVPWRQKGADSLVTGSVTPQGGTVSRLFFGFSGDARGNNPNYHDDYPTAILHNSFLGSALPCTFPQRLSHGVVGFTTALGSLRCNRFGEYQLYSQPVPYWPGCGALHLP